MFLFLFNIHFVRSLLTNSNLLPRVVARVGERCSHANWGGCVVVVGDVTALSVCVCVCVCHILSPEVCVQGPGDAAAEGHLSEPTAAQEQGECETTRVFMYSFIVFICILFIVCFVVCSFVFCICFVVLEPLCDLRAGQLLQETTASPVQSSPGLCIAPPPAFPLLTPSTNSRVCTSWALSTVLCIDYHIICS